MRQGDVEARRPDGRCYLNGRFTKVWPKLSRMHSLAALSYGSSVGNPTRPQTVRTSPPKTPPQFAKVRKARAKGRKDAKGQGKQPWRPRAHRHVRAIDRVGGDGVVSIQAPQYRQYTLTIDFLDFANLIIREEAALATNWIKDRPEGLKLHNLAMATMMGPASSNLP